MEMFNVKVRKVGSSFGILIPKVLAEKERIKEGEEIEVSFAKKRNIETLFKLMGSAKSADEFERDRTDRF